MQKIDVMVNWTGNNYGGGWGDPDLGIILSVGKTWEGFKKDFNKALDFHLEGLEEDGDPLPQWAIDREYEIEYHLGAAALLRRAEEYTTLKAISRASGLKLSVLKKYASAEVCPREEQREKIVNALRTIAKELLSFQ